MDIIEVIISIINVIWVVKTSEKKQAINSWCMRFKNIFNKLFYFQAELLKNKIILFNQQYYKFRRKWILFINGRWFNILLYTNNDHFVLVEIAAMFAKCP